MTNDEGEVESRERGDTREGQREGDASHCPSTNADSERAARKPEDCGGVGATEVGEMGDTPELPRLRLVWLPAEEAAEEPGQTGRRIMGWGLRRVDVLVGDEVDVSLRKRGLPCHALRSRLRSASASTGLLLRLPMARDQVESPMSDGQDAISSCRISPRSHTRMGPCHAPYLLDPCLIIDPSAPVVDTVDTVTVDANDN
jgi:hypothetical protein